jgi:hypothetical protein
MINVNGTSANGTGHNGILSPPVQGLTEMEQNVLSALAGGQMLPTKRLAAAAGYRYGPRLRGCLTGLARRGLIIRLPDGYKLGNEAGTDGTMGQAGLEPLTPVLATLMRLCELTSQLAQAPPSPIHLEVRHAGLLLRLTLDRDASA